jgi:hypothetical protein
MFMVEWAKITFQRRKCIHVYRTCSAASPTLIVIFQLEGEEKLVTFFLVLCDYCKELFMKRKKINLDTQDILQWNNEAAAALNEEDCFLNNPKIYLITTYLWKLMTRFMDCNSRELFKRNILCTSIPTQMIARYIEEQISCYDEKNVCANHKDMEDNQTIVEVHIGRILVCDKTGKVSIHWGTLSLFAREVIFGCVGVLVGILTDNDFLEYPCIIPSKRRIERSRDHGTINPVIQKVQHIKEEEECQVLEKYAKFVYDHHLKIELLLQDTLGNFTIDPLMNRMVTIFSDERLCCFQVTRPYKSSQQSNNGRSLTNIAIGSCIVNFEKSNADYNQTEERSPVKVFSVFVESEKESLHWQNVGSAYKYNKVLADLVPVPVWCFVRVKEGERELRVVEGSCKGMINEGDKIRIGHPFLSRIYNIVGVRFCSDELLVGKQCIYMRENFDHSNVLYEELVKGIDKVSLLHDPKLRLKSRDNRKRLIQSTDLEAGSKEAYYDINTENFSKRSLLAFARIRIWKLVPAHSDHRLQWRKEYDDESVPWFDVSSLPPGEYDIPRNLYNVNINPAQIEKDCHDCLSDPDSSVHQQRLQYFEKVPLGDIIVKTFQTVCNWHPVSSSIDMFKWTRLAKKMKFLTNPKHNYHRLDMIFMKNSLNRKLNLAQFRSVLKNIAAIKFPPSRYDDHVSEKPSK